MKAWKRPILTNLQAGGAAQAKPNSQLPEGHYIGSGHSTGTGAVVMSDYFGMLAGTS